MYAVTGITGKVGAAVARSLLSADQPVRAVVRDPGKGAAWADLGCEIAVADFADAGSLAKAFEGTDGVFAMLPPVFDPAPGFARLPVTLRVEDGQLHADAQKLNVILWKDAMGDKPVPAMIRARSKKAVKDDDD